MFWSHLPDRNDVGFGCRTAAFQQTINHLLEFELPAHVSIKDVKQILGQNCANLWSVTVNGEALQDIVADHY